MLNNRHEKVESGKKVESQEKVESPDSTSSLCTCVCMRLYMRNEKVESPVSRFSLPPFARAHFLSLQF